MKKVLSVLLTVSIILVLLTGYGLSEETQSETAPSGGIEMITGILSPLNITDGVYEGVADGHNGEIAVSVEFKDGFIHDVKVIRHVETIGVTENAVENTTVAIVRSNSPDVDVTSGATFTSRGIMKAVRNAIENAGGNVKDFPAPEKAAPAEDEMLECDVVVVGGGGGGLTAAVRAVQMGADVILLEKNGQLGGDTVLNAGSLVATGSKFQKEFLKEYNDSSELLYEDIMRIGKHANDPAMVKIISETIGETVDWLIDEMGVPYDVAATQYPDHSANRQIGVVGRSPEFFDVMEDKFKEFGGTVLLETRATALLTDEEDSVIGVIAVADDGHKVTIYARSVVLATGGYGANISLLPDTLYGYKFYGRSTDMGDGFLMAADIGADTINLDYVKAYTQGIETVPNRALAATASSTAAANGHGAIYVNTKGERVVNETGTLSEQTEATVEQEDRILYLLMDEDAYRTYVRKSLEDRLVASEDDLNKWYSIINGGKPVIAKSESLDELCEIMGIDAEVLKNTVTVYNANCEKGEDPFFGKVNPVALTEGGIYYIVEQKPRFCTTLGGLKADTDMAILSADGTPVRNLFGAGSVIGGANGRDSMTAMMNSWAIGSGRVGGEAAAKNAGVDSHAKLPIE